LKIIDDLTKVEK